MASEILSVPEEHLLEVVAIIRRGLMISPNATPEVRKQLTTWCDLEEAYMNGVGEYGEDYDDDEDHT